MIPNGLWAISKGRNLCGLKSIPVQWNQFVNVCVIFKQRKQLVFCGNNHTCRVFKKLKLKSVIIISTPVRFIVTAL